MIPVLVPYVRAVAADVIRYRRMVVILFVAINCLAVILGLVWPKRYTANVSILVEDKNILQPLMHGAAVASNTADRTKLAREILFSRRILQKVMEGGGYLSAETTDLSKEKIADSIKGRTRILNFGQNLIRIEHDDFDAERAHKVVQSFADLFISDSLGAQSDDAEAAFAFIDRQVKEYYAKVVAAEERLKEARGGDSNAAVLTQSEVNARINAMQTIIEKTTLDIKEAENKKAFLDRQLAGEAAITVSLARENQYHGRISELQSQLDTLRLSLKDGHPDVVKLKHQIIDLKDGLASEQSKRENSQRRSGTNGSDSGAVVLDDAVRLNPIYQKLRTELLEVQANLASLGIRLSDTKQRVQTDLARQQRLNENQQTVSDLARDYEVNRDIYQDLLKRRESARVSRSLDHEKQQLTLRIAEPAAKPLQPSGLRFAHFAFVGIFLALIVPPGLLYLRQNLDQRIRVASGIGASFAVPVVAVIPHMATPVEVEETLDDLGASGAAMVATVAVVVIIALVKFVGLV